MNNRFLMRMLHSIANLYEELQTVANSQLLLIAVVGDGGAIDVLHREVRLALSRSASVENFGYRRMLHEGQRLPFGLKALHQSAVVHAGPDQFQCDPTAHGLSLLG